MRAQNRHTKVRGRRSNNKRNKRFSNVGKPISSKVLNISENDKERAWSIFTKNTNKCPYCKQSRLFHTVKYGFSHFYSNGELFQVSNLCEVQEVYQGGKVCFWQTVGIGEEITKVPYRIK